MPSLVVVLQEETGHEGEPGKHIAAVVCLNEHLLQTSGEVICANDQALILGVTNGVPIVICSDKRSIYKMVQVNLYIRICISKMVLTDSMTRTIQ